MSSTEILIVAAAAIVVIGAVWYFRGRRGTGSGDVEADVQRERQQAAAAAEEARTEAMVRRVCPHCGVEVEASLEKCPSCGYRF